MHHDQVSEYRNDDKCSQQDWEQHLISVFVDLRPSPDLDILAETEEKDRLTITIRKKASSGRAVRLLPSQQSRAWAPFFSIPKARNRNILFPLLC